MADNRQDSERPRLESWKEIGAYLQRDVRTARRWELEEGLPVHRHSHRSRSSVYAHPAELDAWREGRKVAAEAPVRVFWRWPAFAVTMLLCLIMVGNGVRSVSAQQSKMSDRAVWTGPHVDMFGQVSPDGRFITYVDWLKTGNLMVHDIMANSDRALTKDVSYGQFGEAGFSTISRDGKQVAYEWDSKDSDRQDLFIAALQATGLPNPRQVFRGGDDIRFLNPRDWSPDGKWIAVTINRKDGTGQIALIAVADGTLRVLKSVGWNVPDHIFFSSDGKYIAYDLPANDTNDQHDIFVLAIDGSREIPAVVNPAQESLLGWSPDGRLLLFSSDRTGSMGVWGLPFVDGKPNSAPELLRADIGSSAYSLGLTTSGGLYVWKEITSRDIKIAPIDLNAGKLSGPPVSFEEGFLPRPTVPSWSPDGKYLAYAACGGDCLAIRSVDSGEVRKLPRKLLYVRDSQWSPDGHSLAVGGRDAKGRDGLYRIDVPTGEVSLVTPAGNLGPVPRWSPDGKKIYYYVRSKPALMERDLASGTEREVIRKAFLKWEWDLSPDGRFLAVETTVDPTTKSSSLLLVSVADGQQRELLRLAEPEEWNGQRNIAWDPAGRAVLVAKTAGTHEELLRVPVDGGSVRKLDVDPNIWAQGSQGGLDHGFAVSPDGRQIAFLTGNSAAEVWALENFLPGAGPR